LTTKNSRPTQRITLFFAAKALHGTVSLWHSVEAKTANPNAIVAIARIIRSLFGRQEIIGLRTDSRKLKRPQERSKRPPELAADFLFDNVL
jgi:hypothetical protein